MSQMSFASVFFFILAFSVRCLNNDCRRHYQEIYNPGQQLSSAPYCAQRAPRKTVDSVPIGQRKVIPHDSSISIHIYHPEERKETGILYISQNTDVTQPIKRCFPCCQSPQTLPRSLGEGYVCMTRQLMENIACRLVCLASVLRHTRNIRQQPSETGAGQ